MVIVDAVVVDALLGATFYRKSATELRPDECCTGWCGTKFGKNSNNEYFWYGYQGDATFTRDMRAEWWHCVAVGSASPEASSWLEDRYPATFGPRGALYYS